MVRSPHRKRFLRRSQKLRLHRATYNDPDFSNALCLKVSLGKTSQPAQSVSLQTFQRRPPFQKLQTTSRPFTVLVLTVRAPQFLLKRIRLSRDKLICTFTVYKSQYHSVTHLFALPSIFFRARFSRNSINEKTMTSLRQLCSKRMYRNNLRATCTALRSL